MIIGFWSRSAAARRYSPTTPLSPDLRDALQDRLLQESRHAPDRRARPLLAQGRPSRNSDEPFSPDRFGANVARHWSGKILVMRPIGDGGSCLEKAIARLEAAIGIVFTRGVIWFTARSPNGYYDQEPGPSLLG